MPLSYQHWIAALKQHRRLSVIAFASIMALTLAVILLAPRSYTSEAKLMLRIGRESVTIDPTASTVGEKLNLHHTRENEIQSAIGLMRSRQIVQNVVDQVGEDVVLQGHPRANASSMKSRLVRLVSSPLRLVKGILVSIDPVPEKEKATRHLHEDVYIGSTKNSSVVSVSYTTKSPQVAQDVIASWVRSYIGQHAEANHTPGSYGFFSDQEKVIQASLTKACLALEEAKTASQLVSVTGQQGLLEAQVANVRDSLLQIDSDLAAADARVSSYGDILSDSDAMITSAVTGKMNEGRDLMRDRLFELEVTEKNMESKYKADHPRLIAIRHQLMDAKRIVGKQMVSRNEITRSANPAYLQVAENRLLAKAELRALAKKRIALTQKRTLLMGEIAQLNHTEPAIRALESEVAILEKRHADHAVKMEQSRMEDVLAGNRITSVNIVQPATPPPPPPPPLQMRPVSPNKPLCGVAGLFAAVALAFSLPVLIETGKEHQGRGTRAQSPQNPVTENPVTQGKPNRYQETFPRRAVVDSGRVDSGHRDSRHQDLGRGNSGPLDPRHKENHLPDVLPESFL